LWAVIAVPCPSIYGPNCEGQPCPLICGQKESPGSLQGFRSKETPAAWGLEDFAEELVKEVFGDGNYEPRCSFRGPTGKLAKCDIAIPNKAAPRIVIESKAYGAIGSKMTDIVGDVDAIIENKRHDTAFLFLTDGLSWTARLSDL
jgi:hypothetical protein